MAVSLDELLTEIGLPKAALDRMCSEEHVTCFSAFLDWRKVAPYLGITKGDQEDIDRDFKTESEKRLKCLRRWKEIHASKTTYLMLVEALLMVPLVDQAENICKFVLKSVKDQLESSLPSSVCNQHNSPDTNELGSPFPSPTALLTTAQPLEQITTPQTPLEVQTLPPERKAQTTEEYCFDIFAELLGAGVPHIVLLIISYLSLTSLAVAEKVSTLWRDIIEDLPVWKQEVQRNVETNPMWQVLLERRGWHKYVSQEVPHPGSINYFYRQLHRSIFKDIHSLEANWRRGHYTLTRIETSSQVLCLQYDSKKIVSGHEDNTIKIWNKDTLKLLKILKGHRESVWCLQFADEVIISGSRDHSVKVWDAHTGQIVNDLLYHDDCVYSLKFNLELLVTGSRDWKVAVWCFKSPTAITLKMVLKGHQDYVFAVDISDAYIITGSLDKSIKVWGSSTGELLHSLQHSHWVYSLRCIGSLLVSGCWDGTIRLWDFETGSCLREWKGHKKAIECVTFDNTKIVTGSRDRTVKVWSMSAALEPSSCTEALCVTTLKEHSDLVYGVQFDGFLVVSGCSDGMYLHDFLAPTPPDHIPGPQQLI